MLSAQLVT